MHLPLTTEQFLSLASSYDSIRNGRSFFLSSQWQDLGQDKHHAWASYQVKNKEPLKLVLHWHHGLQVSCTCQEQRFPCAHIIGLGLKFLHHAEMFPQAVYDEPWWEHYRTPAEPLPAQHLSQPSSTMMAGITALERWLKDLFHQGLEIARSKPREVFLPMADRLVDTGMLKLSRDVRLLASLPNRQSDWLEQLLAKLGRLHLLVQGVHRFDSLSSLTQADMLETMAGLAPLDTQPIRDHWQVLARSTMAAPLLKKPCVWLWGKETQRFALLHSELALEPAKQRGASPDTDTTKPHLQPLGWAVGSVVEAELNFVSGSTPLRAKLHRLHTFNHEPVTFQAETSLRQASLDFGKALSRNPWLEHLPMKLAKMAVYHDESWLIQDQEGYLLPLHPRLAHGWHLQALSHDHQLAVFGLWNGEHFTPLSLWHEQACVAIDMWRGITAIKRPLRGVPA